MCTFNKGEVFNTKQYIATTFIINTLYFSFTYLHLMNETKTDTDLKDYALSRFLEIE